MKRILVTGFFDLFHDGHRHFLKEVRDRFVGKGEQLWVGLGTDADALRLKNRSPIYSFAQRQSILCANRHVDHVVGFDVWTGEPFDPSYQDGHIKLIEIVQPSIFVESRQKDEKKIGILRFLKEKGIPIEYVNSIDVHTTDIIERIRRTGAQYPRKPKQPDVEEYYQP